MFDSGHWSLGELGLPRLGRAAELVLLPEEDYVYQGELENLEEVGRKLSRWLQDYNEVAPHSALKMKAPAQFYMDWLASRISKAPIQN